MAHEREHGSCVVLLYQTQTKGYTMPDTAEENTRWVEVWIINDETETYYHEAIDKAQESDEALRDYLTQVLRDAEPESSAWYIAREMTPSDYERVDWHEIGNTLLNRSDDDSDEDDEPELHEDPTGPDDTYQVHVDPIRFAQWGPDCKKSQSYIDDSRAGETETCDTCGNTVKIDSAGYLLIHTRRKHEN